MNHSIWEIIAETPWWVYVIFIFLIWMGIVATKPRLIRINSFYISPIFFLCTSVICLVANFNFSNFIFWVGALFLGGLLSLLQSYYLKMKAIKHSRTIQIPGTWGLLICIVMVFFSKFYFGFDFMIYQQWVKNPKFIFWFIMLYGFFTGFFFVRLRYALRCLKFGPFLIERTQ